MTWYDWNLDQPQIRLLDFTRKLVQLRLAHPNLHRRKFFQDREVRKSSGDVLYTVKDASWFNTDGNEVSDEAWSAGWTRAIALMLNGQTLQIMDEEGHWIIDDSFLILVNAASEGVEFTLPASPSGKSWTQIINTENIEDPFAEAAVNSKIILGGRCVKLLSDESHQKLVS